MKTFLPFLLLVLLLSCQRKFNAPPGIQKTEATAPTEQEQDSIQYMAWYNAKRDSLQSIVFPVDSLLPFGPKALGKMLKDKKHTVSFTVDTINTLDTASRRDIFESWVYYLNFHPYVDGEYYFDNRLPPIKSYEFIKLSERDSLVRNLGIYDETHPFNPYDNLFSVRIANAKGFEIYYATSGTESDGNDCSTHGKAEENCCFLEDYECNTTGTIILYNRKTRHSIIIPAYEINPTGNDEFIGFRFFYIDKDGTINIFEGYSGTEYNHGWERTVRSATVEMSRAYQITVSRSGKVDVEKFIEE